jgi:two-component system, OmpR family, response regulator RegX3
VRIALLEDDASQTEIMKHWLEEAGHHCVCFSSGKSFIKDVSRESYDLFIFDRGLPDMSGDEVLEWVRAHIEAPVPVMFVTAHDTEADIVSGLEKGADDYLVKPVRKLELLARLNALERRSRQDINSKPVLEMEPYKIDTKERKIYHNGKEIELTQKEYELSLFFFKHTGRLLSRGHILESIWGRSPDLNTRTVDTHISRIRNKLGFNTDGPWRLTSVYFYGYRLEKSAPAA